jgi:hypothetical protein
MKNVTTAARAASWFDDWTSVGHSALACVKAWTPVALTLATTTATVMLLGAQVRHRVRESDY